MDTAIADFRDIKTSHPVWQAQFRACLSVLHDRTLEVLLTIDMLAPEHAAVKAEQARREGF
jgi:hypothetical protein